MERVTKKDLEAVCQRINRMTLGHESGPYERNGDGWKPVPSAYHIDGAYGGYALYRMVDDGGTGVHDVLGGHMPKRELYERMQAFIKGMEAA